MKILRITLNNIASLSGTHTVDFSREPLRSAGLFSISGPTGAGKSTLLDALCLALFDSTPRLQQVGRLAELSSGERQNDPRMLLRRGATEGFAEVAFVGVDGQSWTSRWSVRRSHRKADGALQHVEMVLYRGHIGPGGEGLVAEGGKKTAVLSAISEKIGLTFEQFTRAVLLAQNDFATFLKADDKERAEILQALTGTEHFEAISKSVYARTVAEKQAVDLLESKLHGNAPLSVDDRAAADAEVARSAEIERQLELRLKDLESQEAWFRKRALITDERTKAQHSFERATERRAAALPRRSELALTETVSRDGRPLRSAEVQALDDVERATQTRAVALASRETQAILQTQAEANCKAAEAALELLVKEQSESRLLLNQARELDAKLEPLQVQFTKSGNTVAAAQAALEAVSLKLQTSMLQRVACLEEQDSLTREREQLAQYVPFVPDAGKWLDRMDGAIAAAAIVTDARAEWQSLMAQLQQEAERLRERQRAEPELQAAFESAVNLLQDAIVAEAEFDPDQLAAERLNCDISERLLARLGIQLRELRSLQERAELVRCELERLSAEQAGDTTALQELRDVVLPAANSSLQAARSQLERIEAAVDDHANRLRSTLQEGRECPVCGSVNHPYSQHAPDPETFAVKAARESVGDFEARRDEAQTQCIRLDAAIQGRSAPLAARRSEFQELRHSVEQITLDSSDQPEVAAILALPRERQLPAVEERCCEISNALSAIAARETSHRAATKRTQKCRIAMEQASVLLQQLKQQLVDFGRQHDIADQRTLHAAGTLDAADKRHIECMNLLGDIWADLPSAKSEFDADPAGFREAFRKATEKCGRIEKRLAALASKSQEASAAIELLQDSRETAQEVLNRCEFELQSVSSARDQQLNQRSLLFEGKSVDIAEAEINARLQAAARSLEESHRQRSEADRNLATASAHFESSCRAHSLAEAKLAAAKSAISHWLVRLAELTDRHVSTQELDQILARDEVWIKAERVALDELDHETKSAEGAFDVHTKQLQEHLALQFGEAEEPAVLAALEAQRSEVAAAKEKSDAARAIVLSDGDRRRNNQTLADQLERQQATANPWIKLNELLGSADGAKFRMIAQRRTLDILLRHANYQLNLLAVRYRLERLPESLNLIVIDREMGDERRSVHSLSGGESFLVSLALALGLASLASNRLRIESLFIDEGFGSLDPETLNTAMNALMQLEAQGRKVGVISHVAEMTDAIPVQIKVLKGRGGTSRIVVPGTVPEKPAEVSGTETASGAPVGYDGEIINAIAAGIVEILQRNRENGKSKVSGKALRAELGCGLGEFKAAQLKLDGKIVADGRSLRLAET